MWDRTTCLLVRSQKVFPTALLVGTENEKGSWHFKIFDLNYRQFESIVKREGYLLKVLPQIT
jgi:hypothetical protein